MASTMIEILDFQVPRIANSQAESELRRAIIEAKAIFNTVNENFEIIIEDIEEYEDDIIEIIDTDPIPTKVCVLQDGTVRAIDDCGVIVTVGSGVAACETRTFTTGGMSNYDDGGSKPWTSSSGNFKCVLDTGETSQRLVSTGVVFSIPGGVTVTGVTVTVTYFDQDTDENSRNMTVDIASGGSSLSSATQNFAWTKDPETRDFSMGTISAAQANAADFEVWISGVTSAANVGNARVSQVEVEVCYT